jgi:uncharacterized protein
MLTLTDLLPLLLGGLGAGLLGGYLGIGGGIVVMPLLRFGLGMPSALAAGTCVVAVFFTTMGGAYRHARLGHIHFGSLVPVILPGVAAAALFSLVFQCLAVREKWLDLGLGLVFAAISLRMMVEGLFVGTAPCPEEKGGNMVGGRDWQKVVIGIAGGILPGLLGIGTGGILVPSFSLWLKTSIKTAAAASLVCFSFNALVSAAFKYVQGHVELSVALPVCLGTLVGALVGAGLNNRSRPGMVKALFGVVFCFVSVKFILLFLGR